MYTCYSINLKSMGFFHRSNNPFPVHSQICYTLLKLYLRVIAYNYNLIHKEI